MSGLLHGMTRTYFSPGQYRRSNGTLQLVGAVYYMSERNQIPLAQMLHSCSLSLRGYVQGDLGDLTSRRL